MRNAEYLIVMVQTKGRKTGWVGKMCNGTEEDCGWVVGHVNRWTNKGTYNKLTAQNRQSQRGDKGALGKDEVNIKRWNMSCQGTRNTWEKKIRLIEK